jgi:hypothetical protein
MKTFAKITTLFLLAISFFAFAPAVKAADHNADAKALKIQLYGSDRIKIGNAVTAELNSAFAAKAELVVEDAAGKRLVDTDLALDSGKNLVKFKVAEIPAGIYFIKVKVDGKLETVTFVVY